MPLTPISNSIAAGPMGRGFAITPSDTTVLTQPTRGVWVGGAGTIVVLMNGDTVTVTLLGVATGTMLNLSVVKVMATGTTASSIVGLY